MKTTVTFEAINGYLVRLYPKDIGNKDKINYNGVLTIEICDKVAIAKGLHGAISHKNYADVYEYLKNLGVKVCTWERYDTYGNIRFTKTVKIL
jgi:hypothetical protein